MEKIKNAINASKEFFKKHFNNIDSVIYAIYILSVLGIIFSILLFFTTNSINKFENINQSLIDSADKFASKNDIVEIQKILKQLVPGIDFGPLTLRQAYQYYLGMTGSDTTTSKEKLDIELLKINNYEDYLKLVNISKLDENGTDTKKVSDITYLLKILQTFFFSVLVIFQTLNAILAVRLAKLSHITKKYSQSEI